MAGVTNLLPQFAASFITNESSYPPALYSEADAQTLLAQYPDIFAGFVPFTVGDALANMGQSVDAGTAAEFFNAGVNDALAYAMTLQPGIVPVVTQTFYTWPNFPGAPVIDATGMPQFPPTAYKITPQQQVMDQGELFNLDGYGYLTYASNLNGAAQTAAATETAQADQINLVQQYSQQILEARRENPGFWGSAEGFFLIAGAVIGLAALANYAGIGAVAGNTANVGAAGGAADVAGNVGYANGVIYAPGVGGANGAFFIPDAAAGGIGSGGAWVAVDEGVTITANATTAALETLSAAITNGEATVSAVTGITVTDTGESINTLADIGNLVAANTSGTSLLPTTTDVTALEDTGASLSQLPQATISTLNAAGYNNASILEMLGDGTEGEVATVQEIADSFTVANSGLSQSALTTLANQGYSSTNIADMLSSSDVNTVEEIASNFETSGGNSAWNYVTKLANQAVQQITSDPVKAAKDAAGILATGATVLAKLGILGSSPANTLTDAQRAALNAALQQAVAQRANLTAASAGTSSSMLGKLAALAGISMFLLALPDRFGKKSKR